MQLAGTEVIQFQEVDAVSDGSLGGFALQPQRLDVGRETGESILTCEKSPGSIPDRYVDTGPPSTAKEGQVDEEPAEGEQGASSGIQGAHLVQALPKKGCTAERLDDGDDHSPLSLNFHPLPHEQSSQPPQEEIATS